MPQQPTNDTLVFSVAVNGYHLRYRRLLESQRRYAERHGYTYLVINRPLFSLLGNETAWLKLSAALVALESGYKRVFYIDADAEVRDSAPPLESLIEPDKSLYAARGYSGRINSGVLLFTDSPAAHHFLHKVIDNIETPLPPEDDVGWGENGHIIHFLKGEPEFHELPVLWNNNQDPDLDDFIRHYSAGPLRHLYSSARRDLLLFNCLSWPSRIVRAAYRALKRERPVSAMLPALTNDTAQKFSKLRKAD